MIDGQAFQEEGEGRGGDLRVGDGYRVGDKGIPPNLPPARTTRLSIHTKVVVFQNGIKQLLCDRVI